MLEKMMITVSNESWTQGFWLKEFNAEHQVNIIRRLETRWGFSFDKIFPIYMSRVDVQQLDHINLLPINVVMEYFRDKLSPILNDDCYFELYKHSYDCAYGVYVKNSDSKWGYSLVSDNIPLGFIKYGWYGKNGEEFLRIDGVDYNWSRMDDREVVQLVIKKALHG